MIRGLDHKVGLLPHTEGRTLTCVLHLRHRHCKTDQDVLILVDDHVGLDPGEPRDGLDIALGVVTIGGWSPSCDDRSEGTEVVLSHVAHDELEHRSTTVLEGHKLTKRLPLTGLFAFPRFREGSYITRVVTLDIGRVHRLEM